MLLVGGPDGPYSNIQLAVDAASDGDTLLVWPGIYGSFTVDNKSLVVSRRIPFLAKPDVYGEIRIQNLAPEKRVVLRGIDVFAIFDNATAGLTLRSNDGSVRVDDVEAIGSPPSGAPLAFAGAYLSDSRDVAFTECILQGGPADATSTAGAPGIHAIESFAALYQSTAIGGPGFFAPAGQGLDGGEGGPGLLASSCILYSSQVQLFGGVGGNGSDALGDCTQGGIAPGSGGDGGIGVVLLAAGDVLRVAPGEVGGGGGGLRGQGVPCGAQSGLTGADSHLAPESLLLELHVSPALIYSGSQPALEGQPYGLGVYGEPGASVVLYVSSTAQYDDVGPLRGVQLIGAPFARRIALGTVPAGGYFTANVQVGNLPAGVMAQTWYLQALITGSEGARWTSPDTLLIVDSTLL